MIQFNKVTKTYTKNNKIALDEVSVHIPKGEFVFIVGSSGAGKSTFIKLLLKEIDPDKGEVIINNFHLHQLSRRTLPKLRRSMGVIFQDFRLLPNKNVFENIAFAMEITGRKKRDIRRKVPTILSMVRLSEKGNAYPHELSGGEQQRVSIARALVNEPDLLVADEPTGNLDPQNARDILSLLHDINRTGTTVLVATHAQQIVDEMQKRVITIKDGKIASDVREGTYFCHVN